MSNKGVPIGWAILAALAMGLAVGAANGFFIICFRIHSLIVTLGIGTFLHGVTLWISDPMTISGISSALINAVIVTRLFGIPLEFYYALAILRHALVRVRIHGARPAHPVRRARPGGRAAFGHQHRPRALGLPDRLEPARRARRRALCRHAGRGRSGLGHFLSSAGFRRRLPRIDQHHSRPLQSLGHAARGLFPGHGHHRADLHGRQHLRAGHLLWRRRWCSR